MSIEALAQVIDHSEQSHGHLVVMIMVANSINAETREAWCGIDFLARKSRLSARSIIDILPVLEASGELVIRRGEGPKGTHVYRLGPHYTAIGGGADSSGEEIAGVKSADGKLHPILYDPKTPSQPKIKESLVEEGLGAESRREISPTPFVSVEEVEKFQAALLVQERIPNSVRQTWLGRGLKIARVAGGVTLLYQNEQAPKVVEEWRDEIDAVVSSLGWGRVIGIRME